MKQVLKKFINILLVFLLLIGGSIFVIVKYFSDDIEKSIIKTIEKSLNNPVILDEVDFTIYENFPNASVKISNLLLLESKNFNDDTLLFTKRAYVTFSLLDVINKNYDIKEIIITNAKINIKYNELNLPNFHIFKKNKQKSKISIEKVTILNSDLKIKKEITQLYLDWFLNRSIINIKKNDYSFITNGFSKFVEVGNTNYLDNKKFDFNCNSNINKDTVDIISSLIEIENIMFNLNGSVISGDRLNMKIDVNNQNISDLIDHLPKKIRKICSPFIASGEISFNSTLIGIMNKESNPLFEMNYIIKDGNFNLKSNSFKLNNIQMEGNVSNGLSRNFKSTKIVAKVFDAKMNNGYLRGRFILNNLNTYLFSSKFTSSWDLSELSRYFENSQFVGLKGRMSTTTSYKGNIAFNRKFKNMFLNASHSSDLNFRDVYFSYDDLPLKFNIESMNCKLVDQNLAIYSSSSNISKSNIEFNGEIQNLSAYILEAAPKIYVSGNIVSKNLDLVELMTLGDITKNKELNPIMPDWLNITTYINVKNFEYKTFESSDLTAKISYSNQILFGDSLITNLLDGNLSGRFNFIEPKINHLKMKSEFVLKKINIRNSFNIFNNYGQEFIKKENLNGIGSAELDIEAYWKPNFLIDKKRLKVRSHLIIEKGELIEFEPLESLSSYVSIDELKHVTFSKLENTIDIANEIITIPTMEIKSSALSLLISGTHSFKKEINYEITLLLSELISDGFRKKNTQITDFGEEKKDGKIFNTVYFKMTGDTENPKISLNKIRFMEDLNKSLIKEKKIISNIIKQDILQNEAVEVKEEGQDIQIKWDPKF